MLEDKYPDITPCYNLVKVANLLAYIYGYTVAVEDGENGAKSLVFRTKEDEVWASQMFDPRLDEERGLYQAIRQIIMKHPNEIFFHIRENVNCESGYSSEMNQNIANLKLGLATYIIYSSIMPSGEMQVFALEQTDPLYPACYQLFNGGLPHDKQMPYHNRSIITDFMRQTKSLDQDNYQGLVIAREFIESACKYINKSNNVMGIAINVFAANCVKSLETGSVHIS